jgi:hypothetical protein
MDCMDECGKIWTMPSIVRSDDGSMDQGTHSIAVQAEEKVVSKF